MKRFIPACTTLLAGIFFACKTPLPEEPVPDPVVPPMAMIVDREPPGRNCIAGGQRITRGRDINQNLRIDPAEIASTKFICAKLVGNTITDYAEEDGTHCRLGGVTWARGTDKNRDKELGNDEVEVAYYLCYIGDDQDSQVTDKRNLLVRVRRSVIDSMLKEPGRISRFASYYDAIGQYGYQLRGIKDSDLEKLGFEDGDIIHIVNDKPLSSAKEAQLALESERAKSELVFQLTRRALPTTLRLEVFQ